MFLWKFNQTGSYLTLLDTSIAYISVLTTFIFLAFQWIWAYFREGYSNNVSCTLNCQSLNESFFFKIFISILSEVKTGLHDTNYRETVNHEVDSSTYNESPYLHKQYHYNIWLLYPLYNYAYSKLKKNKFKEIVLEFVHRLNTYVDSKATKTDYSVPRLKSSLQNHYVVIMNWSTIAKYPYLK